MDTVLTKGRESFLMSAFESGMPAGLSSSDVRYPENLAINFDSFQSVARQLVFIQPQKSKMRQVTKHGLKPAVSCENLAHALVEKLVRVKRQHRNMLRSSRRRDRIKHGL